jgi:pyrroloquinoline quinone biosynthesis protein B
MLVRILGAAAGGGFPQWNCHCHGCETSRAGKAKPLTQSSIAVRANNGDWFLINASPDVRSQIESMRSQCCFVEEGQRSASADISSRSLPFAGIILTDAEIDHTTGLILLRESSQPLKIYSPASVKSALTTGYPLLNTLENYCGVEWFPLMLEEAIPISSDLEIEAFALSTKPPKYMQGDSDQIWGIGLTIRDHNTGGILTYAPGLASIDEAMQRRLNASDCILIDGTFWTNDELPALGIGSRSALQMGHLPLSGEEGSLKKLAQTTTPRKILVHINNTNPILIPDSSERQIVESKGIEIGDDGLMFTL